jgi:hypothetical protein
VLWSLFGLVASINITIECELAVSDGQTRTHTRTHHRTRTRTKKERERKKAEISCVLADGLQVADADEMSGAVDFALHLGVLLGREPGSVGIHDLQHERSPLGQHAHVDVLSARRRKSHLCADSKRWPNEE